MSHPSKYQISSTFQWKGNPEHDEISVTAESPIKAVKEFIRILSEKMGDGIEEIHNIEIHRVD